MSGPWGEVDEESFLSRLPPGPHRLPRELVRVNQRQRILLAALDVFAERGYEAATIKDIIRKARVSRATFYEVFVGKEACMVALHEEILRWLSEQVTPAIAEAAEWSAQVRVGAGLTVDLLAADPRLAFVCAVEAPALPVARIRQQHEAIVERLCAGLRAGRTESRTGKQLPEILETALVHGAIYMIGRAVVYGKSVDVEALRVELTNLILAPYLD